MSHKPMGFRTKGWGSSRLKAQCLDRKPLTLQKSPGFGRKDAPLRRRTPFVPRVMYA